MPYKNVTKRYGSLKKQLILLALFVLVVMYVPGVLEDASTWAMISTAAIIISLALLVFLFLKRTSIL